ncbi:unnamed protein product [Musa banksii]
MTGDGSHRSTRQLLLLLLSIALHLIPGSLLSNSWISFLSFILRNIFFLLGLSENPSPSKDSTKADSHSSSRSNTGLKVLLICLGAIALVLLSYFLFKKWQKKKREEQHARLLKLFEEDDDLEVELGLRD